MVVELYIGRKTPYLHQTSMYASAATLTSVHSLAMHMS